METLFGRKKREKRTRHQGVDYETILPRSTAADKDDTATEVELTKAVGNHQNQEVWGRNLEGQTQILETGRSGSAGKGTKLSQTKGRMYMLGVAALWGSYVPCLKVLYTMEGPPSISTYTALHLMLSWTFLKLCSGLYSNNKSNSDSNSNSKRKEPRVGVEISSEQGEKRDLLSAYKEEEEEEEKEEEDEDEGTSTLAAKTNDVSRNADAGELAFWDISATVLQTWGVTLTSAVHAGVIVCLATGFVPVLSYGIMNQKPRTGEVVACSIALIGAILLALDGTQFDATDGDALASLLANGSFVGDMLTALSALFYAICMVRIHQKTQDKDSTMLAVDKVFFAGLISMVWVLGDLVYEGGGIHSFWPNYKSIEQWLLLLFISIGPSALSNVLQFKALSTLKPSEGQVILSTVPLWAVAFSFLTLGNSVSLGLLAYGGLLMICSSFLSLWLVNLIEE